MPSQPGLLGHTDLCRVYPIFGDRGVGVHIWKHDLMWNKCDKMGMQHCNMWYHEPKHCENSLHMWKPRCQMSLRIVYFKGIIDIHLI
jgi:hypothetical protein